MRASSAATATTSSLPSRASRSRAILIPKIKVGVSQDGTAGIANLFMAVWVKVIAGGSLRSYDWTIKVEREAVITPWRIRDNLRPPQLGRPERADREAELQQAEPEAEPTQLCRHSSAGGPRGPRRTFTRW